MPDAREEGRGEPGSKKIPMLRALRVVIFLLLLGLLAGSARAGGNGPFQRGVDAFQKGQYPQAVRAFQDAVRQRPDDALCRLWLGMSYHRVGQLRSAREAFEEASRLGGASRVGQEARKNLEALQDVPGAPPAPRPRPSPSPKAEAGASPLPQSPTSWRPVGPQEGLLGDDWYQRDTRYCRAWARKGDLPYLEEVLASLDPAWEINSRFMGFQPKRVLEFYFFGLAEPGQRQPRFASVAQGHSRFAGLALGPSLCLVNLGNPRTSNHFEPWDVARVACHEMNHMFLSNLRIRDRAGDRSWLAEALAHTVEDRVLPPSAQADEASLKAALRGYRDVDEDWQTLVRERDDDTLENYRQYGLLLSSIIYFLQGRYGKDAVPRLMRATRPGTLDAAFEEAFGKDLRTLHQEWKDFYGIR